METQKKVKGNTPAVGSALYAHLQKPKPAFRDAQGRVKEGDVAKYQLDVVFDPKEPKWFEWLTGIQARVNALPRQVNRKTGDAIPHQYPANPQVLKDGTKTGMYVVSFKTNAFAKDGRPTKPPTYDEHGLILDENILIGNGSKVLVSYTENVYDSFGGGMNLYLNAVLIKELIEYQANSAKSHGFAVTEAPVVVAESTPANADADEIPFQ